MTVYKINYINWSKIMSNKKIENKISITIIKIIVTNY